MNCSSWDSFENYSVVPNLLGPRVGWLFGGLSRIEVEEVLKCDV